MAFFNDLVRVVANIEGLDEMTVRGIGIKVREKGYISKGGRGLSASKMSINDAANLIIGTNASGSSKGAGEAVSIYRNLVVASEYKKYGPLKGTLGNIFSKGNSFGNALETLMMLSIPNATTEDPLGQAIMSDIDFGKNLNPGKSTSKLVDDKIKIEINFTRPEPIVNVRIQDAWTDEMFNQVNFYGASFEIEHDRYDITAISQKTLRAVTAALGK